MFSLYIHIPFCARKCKYCDFYSVEGGRAEVFSAYTDALIRQIEPYRGAEIGTVYFGGGTPSLLPLSEYERLFAGLRGRFALMPDAEISIEVNPTTVDGDYLAALRRIGVNRVSIGAQSFDDGELRALGRLHNAEAIAQTVGSARTAGFENISLDLMFGIPNQTEGSLDRSLEAAVSLGVCHISLYGLKIERGTPFWHEQNSLALPNEDTEAQMYLRSVDFVARQGIMQYEISNFAVPGRECRHNLTYWTGGDYLGLGPAAASLADGRRFTLRRDLTAYINCRAAADFEALHEDVELLTPQERARERIILGLRLSRGVPLELLENKKIDRYLAAGMAVAENGRFALTPRGMLVSNRIIGDLAGYKTS